MGLEFIGYIYRGLIGKVRGKHGVILCVALAYTTQTDLTQIGNIHTYI